MEHSGAVVATLLIVLCVVTPAVAAGSTQHTTAAATSQQSFDRNQVILTVYGNQSTRWTFHYERTLDNETERQNFKTFATEFNQNTTRLYSRFEHDGKGLVSDGNNTTGRQMAARNFSRHAYIRNTSTRQTVGVVEMSFMWTNFTAKNGQNIVVGDVFDGGLYLGPKQKLVVRHGPSLVFAQAVPQGELSNPDSLSASDTVTWQGEREFNDKRPHIVFRPKSAKPVQGTNTTETNVANESSASNTTVATVKGSTGGDGSTPWLVGLLALLVLAGIGAAWWYYQHSDGEFPSGMMGGSDGDDGDDDSGPDAPLAEPSVEDTELLSDEDRVVSLLEERGGRMKQVNIVEATGWSKSKVSMLLSDMADEDIVSKLRVGRENVISLKGHEPEATRSPFDKD